MRRSKWDNTFFALGRSDCISAHQSDDVVVVHVGKVAVRRRRRLGRQEGWRDWLVYLICSFSHSVVRAKPSSVTNAFTMENYSTPIYRILAPALFLARSLLPPPASPPPPRPRSKPPRRLLIYLSTSEERRDGDDDNEEEDDGMAVVSECE